MPPGKKWPTLRVRTTTSSRADSPRRSAASTLSSGPVTSEALCTAARDVPKLIDSSPCANVELSRGSAAPAAFADAASPSPSPPRTRPNTSIVTAPAFRNACVTSSWSLSPFTKGSAVLAPGKRCEWIFPSRAAGSFDGTSGMWQSAHICGLGG